MFPELDLLAALTLVDGLQTAIRHAVMKRPASIRFKAAPPKFGVKNSISQVREGVSIPLVSSPPEPKFFVGNRLVHGESHFKTF
jgi:hypothetical protein